MTASFTEEEIKEIQLAVKSYNAKNKKTSDFPITLTEARFTREAALKLARSINRGENGHA